VPILVIFNREMQAEKIALWVYLFLFIGTIHRLIEQNKHNIPRISDFLKKIFLKIHSFKSTISKKNRTYYFIERYESIILAYGLILRFWSIVKIPSFWNDEIHVAIMARSIIEVGTATTSAGTGEGFYQILLYYISALFLLVGGVNEFTARLPSLLAGVILIWVIYLITKSVLGKQIALVAIFLAALSQMQLAWSTQLRPYIWLELFTLLNCFFLYKFILSKKFLDRDLLFAVVSAIISSLFHGTGLINLIIVTIVLGYKILLTKQFKHILTIGLISLVGLTIFAFSLPNVDQIFVKLFQFNTDLLHYRIFLTHNYWWLLLGAGFGAFSLWKTNQKLLFVILISIITIFVISIFKISTRYVRYSLPAFPLLYILFSVGIVWVYREIRNRIKIKFSSLISIFIIGIIFFLFPIYKGKIILFPQKYYSINADMRENPIVDYKTAFSKIDRLIKDKDDVLIMDAWNDRIPWYLPGQKFIWLTWEGKGQIDPVFGEKMIGSMKGFEQEKNKYSSGIVIVENWPSLTPPELQDHIRKTLKFEFTQDTVLGNEKDPWSISIYSWGL